MLTVELKDACEAGIAADAPCGGNKHMPVAEAGDRKLDVEGEEVWAGKEDSDHLTTDTADISRNRNESSASDGLEHVSTKDLFKKRNTVYEDGITGRACALPLSLLPGETLLFQGRTITQHLLLLTTFRLFVARSNSFINIPLGLIESAECVDVAKINLLCRDGTTHCCVLANSEACFKWLSRIKQEITAAASFNDIFATWLHAAVSMDSLVSDWETGRSSQYSLDSEMRRLGFKKNWKITNANENYRCCSTYPKENLVPKSFDEDGMEKVTKFRTRGRFPSAVWRNRENGCVLLRSSQPVVGVFLQRSSEDENMLQAVMAACNDSKDMTIVDCRSYIAAQANRAKGGGLEYSEYYDNCRIEFMGLANIHNVRASFAALRTLVSATVTDANWYSQLDATKWMLYLSALLEAARFVADALAHRPVLVHCSDGWDRTPQIVSLAQLILDPYYRTFKGFQVLIEKEWLLFGHKFADRCGHSIGGADPHEASPVFVQWLDAVYQLCRQFPTAFEFGEAYLRKLMQHVYSCLFGTFLCNTEREREELRVYDNSISFWSFVSNNTAQLSNRLYTHGVHKVLNVSSRASDLSFWMSAYASASLSQAEDQYKQSGTDESAALARSQSYTDISSSVESSGHLGLRSSRTLSDPDLTSSTHALSGGDAAGSLNHDSSSVQLHSNSSINNVLTGSGLLSGSPVIIASHMRSSNDAATSSCGALNSSGSSLKQRNENQKGKDYQYKNYIDEDGLTIYRDPIQQRIEEISASHRRKIHRLEKRILELETRPRDACQCVLLSPDEIDTAPGSAESGSDRSDSSWEEVSHKDTGLTLWIPDHAVSSCSSCQIPFRVYRRRHHCRQCGQVFCQTCADVYVPIPTQQLFDPVRVCRSCHNAIISVSGKPVEQDEADILEQSVQSARNRIGDSSFDQADEIVCSSSPRDIPKRQQNHKAGGNSRASCSPAILPVTLHEPERSAAVSSNGNSSDLTYKTCSLESINSDNSKLENQHVVGPTAKC